MLLTTLATAARKKNSEETEGSYSEFQYKTKVSNTLNNMSQIVVMSGSATRGSIRKNEPKPLVKTFEEKEDHEYEFEFIQKTSIKQLSRPQVPSYKSRCRKFQREEKIMSKSCESIFKYLKSYRDGTSIEDLQGEKFSQSCGSILKTNISIERKAKRKVQFMKVCKENPIPLFLDGQESLAKFESSKIMKNHDKLDYSDSSECPQIKNFNNRNQGDIISGGTQKTISSEDFIENVVLVSEPLTLGSGFPEYKAK